MVAKINMTSVDVEKHVMRWPAGGVRAGLKLPSNDLQPLLFKV
jgi:hypothetical protein